MTGPVPDPVMGAATPAPPRKSMTLSPARRASNLLMGGLILLATLVVVAPLVLIFIYLLREGLGAMNADFFTKVPAPEGETGGGSSDPTGDALKPGDQGTPTIAAATELEDLADDETLRQVADLYHEQAVLDAEMEETKDTAVPLQLEPEELQELTARYQQELKDQEQ